MFGSFVEGEDGEDEGVSDDADVLEQGLLHGLPRRRWAVEAAHEGELRWGDGGVGGGDGDGRDGDGDVTGAVESEILEEDEGARIRRDFEGLHLWFC